MASANPTLRGDTDDVLGHARGDATLPSSSLLTRIVRTDARLVSTFARVCLGLMMAIDAVIGSATSAMQLPGSLASLAFVTEVVCAVLLFAGALTRVAAAGVIAVTFGAIAYWAGQHAGDEVVYHLLAIPLGIVVLVAGGGRASIDLLLMRRRPMPGGSIDDRFVNP